MALKDFFDYVKWEFEQRTGVDFSRRERERERQRWEEEERRRREREEERRERARERAERERERAEREKAMRLSTLKSDTESAARELSAYKRSTVNPQLTSSALQNQSAMRVSEQSMNDDVQSSIRSKIAYDERHETLSLSNEIEAIDSLMRKLSEIERAS